MLLQPGTYTIVIEGRDAAGGMNPDVNFIFYADRVSDPIGPPVIDPGSQPAFSCDDLSGLFCFPAQPPTTQPVVITDPSTPAETPSTVPVQTPLDGWFWTADFLPTNPIDPLDTNGDRRVTAFDALGVINYLNLYGVTLDPVGVRMTSYMDVNGDGKISAFDALPIINFLNLHPVVAPGSGGEAVSADDAGAIATDRRLALLIQAADEALARPQDRAVRPGGPAKRL